MAENDLTVRNEMMNDLANRILDTTKRAVVDLHEEVSIAGKTLCPSDVITAVAIAFSLFTTQYVGLIHDVIKHELKEDQEND